MPSTSEAVFRADQLNPPSVLLRTVPTVAALPPGVSVYPLPT
jgi:hypothetical protein